ncbi:MAG: four helix bundle protein [Armatimonadetes bacterium]|nr:four helix bundle protein [Armatimonadota bacterium]
MARSWPEGFWVSKFRLKDGRTRAVLGWKDPTGRPQRKEFSANDPDELDGRIEAYIASLSIPESVLEYAPDTPSSFGARERQSDYVATHRDLRVYQRAIELSQEVRKVVGSFPADERFSLSDQFLRSSRSVCANLAEAWRKRRYRAAFVSKLSDVEGECAETQVWAEIAWLNHYCSEEQFRALFVGYEELIRSVVNMISHSDKWTTLPKPR